jgi:hypothetical protein
LFAFELGPDCLVFPRLFHTTSDGANAAAGDFPVPTSGVKRGHIAEQRDRSVTSGRLRADG